MPIIDYSNISTYNVSALQDVDKYHLIFSSIDKILGINYLFGVVSLVVIYIVILLIFRDYDIKISSLVSSFISLIVAIFYYFAGIIAWTHLAIAVGIYLITLILTWNWSGE